MFKTKPEGSTTIDQVKKVNIDQRLLKECDGLAKLDGPHDDQLLSTHKQWLNAYKSCAATNSALVKEVKKAFNLEK